MAYTVTVTSRVVNDDGSIQYQMDDGTGIILPNQEVENDWCDEQQIDIASIALVNRIAICKTVHNGVNAIVDFNIDDANGNIMRVS